MTSDTSLSRLKRAKKATQRAYGNWLRVWGTSKAHARQGAFKAAQQAQELAAVELARVLKGGK